MRKSLVHCEVFAVEAAAASGQRTGGEVGVDLKGLERRIGWMNFVQMDLVVEGCYWKPSPLIVAAREKPSRRYSEVADDLHQVACH